MDLKGLLLKKKSGIVKKWIHSVVITYDPETSIFLKKNTDRFANPVGSVISSQIETLFDALVNKAPRDEISASLDRLIRIRAVQDFSPSEAVGFVFSFKPIIREELKKEIEKEPKLKGLAELETRLDETALLAFDVYKACREKIHQIKRNEFMKAGLPVHRRNQGRVKTLRPRPGSEKNHKSAKLKTR